MYTQSDQPKLKIARLYLRVSTDEQDLTRQIQIEHSARAAGYYIAGIYKEKASGARADRPELLRMIRDLQPDEVVVCERLDRLSRLPLAEAEQLVASISTCPLRFLAKLAGNCEVMQSGRRPVEE